MKKRLHLHKSVLLEEVLSFFEKMEPNVFLDGTLGAGGHAEALLNHHPEIKKYIGLDVDPIARDEAKNRLKPFEKKLHVFSLNFSQMDQACKRLKVDCVDGILLDIGVSSMQIDQPERGFSFQSEGDLDMRMDPALSLTAKEIVNKFSEKKLGEIFREFGEEPQWRKAARVIVENRKKKMNTTKELSDLLRIHLRKRKRIHPATLVFQALRIYVNQELFHLNEGLEKGVDLLCPHGRMAVISFHSLEDRIVKHFFKQRKDVRILTKKPVQADLAEIKKNPRSRSAKLRVVEKL